MRSIFSVANVLGRMLMVFSLMYLTPITCSAIYEDETLGAFLLGMLASLGSGRMLYLLTLRRREDLRPRDGFVLVTLAWTLVAAIATAPSLIHHRLSFTDAFFETMSGLTTTGATVMTGLDAAPQAINLWRHELNWLGGMGIIVLAVAILPLLGVGGMQLLRAEVPGPIKDARLTALIADTASALWGIYAGITLICVLCLKAAGMDWLDAVCHAFAALSLGGFSTRDASIGAFDAPAVEAVLILFMVIACINTAGPGLGEAGPATNYASLTDYEIWVCSFTMLLGRLEVFSILILFTPGFWRK